MIETLLEEFQPRTFENDEFEYRQNSDNSCAFRHFGTFSKTLLIVQKLGILIRRLFYKQQAVNTLMEEEVEPIVMEE